MKIINIKNILSLFPLRIAITDYCNLRCFFCSNEGLLLSQKNKKHININQLKYLIKTLHKAGLRNLSLTGGDPTLHPKIIEIIDFINNFNFENVFIHTNGINLNKRIIKKLSQKFTKIAVSIHSVNYKTWQKMTGGSQKQFEKIILNLKNLSKLTEKLTIELKLVPIKGYNDSKKEFLDFLELCNNFNFKFKILNFEPIIKQQIRLVVPFKKIERILKSIGCKTEPIEKKFRGQSNYLPIKKFKYKNISGVAIEIGCGDKKVCKECYHSNEIFISPYMKIKPCHMDNYEINIADFIKKGGNKAILKSILDSRIFLTRRPGANIKVWQNNK